MAGHVHHYVDQCSDQPAEMCGQWHEMLEQWRLVLQNIRMEEGIKHLEGCIFTEATTMELTAWVGSCASLMERLLPRKCGECAVCFKEQGKCVHGWSSEDVCPDCSGRLL